MNPLYNNAASKHFKLTSIFSFNINFYILYPQLYSTAINHVNHLQKNLASEKLSKMKHSVVFSFSLPERSSSDLLWRTETHQTFIVINVHSKGSWERAQKLIHNKIVLCNGRTYCLAKVYK